MITLEMVKQGLQAKRAQEEAEDVKSSLHVIERCEKELSRGILKVSNLTRNEIAIDLAIKHFTDLGFKVKKKLNTVGSRSHKKKNFEFKNHTLFFSVE